MNVPMMIENKVTNSLRGSVLNLLNRDYQFIVGEKIQDMFASDIVDLVNTCYKEPWKLDVGQILWYGAAVDEKPNYGKNSSKTRLTPCILTLINKDDLEMKKNGYSNKEIIQVKIIRLFNEAYEQLVLLTHSDAAFLLHISTGTVGKVVNEYMRETGKIVPTRGIIHDIGRAMTHKKIIVRLYKKGYQTPEIARKTSHTIEACDRYIKAYKRVEKLNTKMSIDEIAQTLGMGKSLVKEYLNLIDDKEVK